MVAVSCRKALEQYIQATNTHEFENVKKLLHPDAVYWFSDETCSGVKEIQRYFENAWKQIENEVYSAVCRTACPLNRFTPKKPFPFVCIKTDGLFVRFRDPTGRTGSRGRPCDKRICKGRVRKLEAEA